MLRGPVFRGHSVVFHVSVWCSLSLFRLELSWLSLMFIEFGCTSSDSKMHCKMYCKKYCKSIAILVVFSTANDIAILFHKVLQYFLSALQLLILNVLAPLVCWHLFLRKCPCFRKMCRLQHCRIGECTTFAADQADRGRPLSSSLSIHRCCRFYSVHRVVLLNILCWSSRSSRRKWNPGCRLSPGGATLCYKFHEVRVNKCVQCSNKTALKCAKNHANWLMRLGDVGSQNSASLVTFSPTLYFITYVKMSFVFCVATGEG